MNIGRDLIYRYTIGITGPWLVLLIAFVILGMLGAFFLNPQSNPSNENPEPTQVTSNIEQSQSYQASINSQSENTICIYAGCSSNSIIEPTSTPTPNIIPSQYPNPCLKTIQDPCNLRLFDSLEAIPK